MSLSSLKAKSLSDATAVAAKFSAYVQQLTEVLGELDHLALSNVVSVLQRACETNKTIFVVGNGVSAAVASQWSTNLSKGVFYRTGKRVKCLSLTDNMSWITAVANDTSFTEIFSDQLRALAEPGDILVCLSTFGNSMNVLSALSTAQELGLETCAIVGFEGGEMVTVSQNNLLIPTKQHSAGLVEETQLVLSHFLSNYLSEKLLAE